MATESNDSVYPVKNSFTSDKIGLTKLEYIATTLLHARIVAYGPVSHSPFTMQQIAEQSIEQAKLLIEFLNEQDHG